MKNEHDDLIRTVLQAADGEIIGRIRIQKVFYLLEQLGADTGLWFSYHHYGPYSKDLTDALDEAEIDGVILDDQRAMASGVSGFYSVYTLEQPTETPPATLGRLTWDDLCDKLTLMKGVNSIVIELAATIRWLQHAENVSDWLSELKVRKTSKATDERIEEACLLLENLGFPAGAQPILS